MPSKQADTQSSDNSGKLSAIWLLSCNDKNAIMTYIGVARRLSLPEDYVRSMVDKHPELFRKGFPEERLKIWREQLSMLKTPPAWLQEPRRG
jgi:hypothetical protein